MMKKLAAAALVGCCAAALSGQGAQAVEVLGEVKKGEGLEVFGSAAEKKFREIDLGNLRTDEPRLPGGIISVKDRMRIRAEREAARQAELAEKKKD